MIILSDVQKVQVVFQVAAAPCFLASNYVVGRVLKTSSISPSLKLRWHCVKLWGQATRFSLK